MKKDQKLAILFILILGLLVFAWFEKDLIYSYGDAVFDFFPLENLNNYYTTWFSKASTGIPNSQSIPHFPYHGFLALAQFLSLPLYLAQRFLFYFLFVAGGLSMYFLVMTVFSQDERRNIFGLMAAVFYMLNSYSLVLVWGIMVQSIFIYPLLPLLLAVFIRGLKNPNKLTSVLIFCLVSFLASPSFSNVAFAVLIWVLILPLFIFFLVAHLKDKAKLKQGFKFFAPLVIFWLVLNLYWLIPFGYSAKGLSAETVASKAFSGGSVKALENASVTAHLLNSFRLFGYNYFDLRLKFMEKDPFYSYAGTYDSPLFIILSFFIPLITFSSLLFFRREKNENQFYLFYFFLFTLSVLFFYKGSQPPLGGFFVWLMKKVPFMTAFRHPVSKIGVLLPLGFAFLFGYSFSNFYQKIKEKLSEKPAAIMMAVLFLALFVVYQYPFWTRNVFHPQGEIARSALVKIPEDYNKAGAWLRSQKQMFRLAEIPATGSFGIAFDWEHGYDGSNLIPFLLNRSLVTAEKEDELGSFLNQVISKGDKSGLAEVKNLLGLLHVKYLLFHNDIALDYFNTPKEVLKQAGINLENGIDGLTKERTFGKLDFYKLNEQYFLPLIFTPSAVVLSAGSLNSLVDILVNSRQPAQKAIFFKVDLNNNNDVFAEIKGYNNYSEIPLPSQGQGVIAQVIDDFETPGLTFSKVNQAKYKIKVQQAKQDFLLVFNESFHPDWRVYFKVSDDKNEKNNVFETLSLVSLDEKNHLKVNGYANSWWIKRPCEHLKGQKLVKFVSGFECLDKEKAENFEIILEFFPQRIFPFGFLASGAGLLFLFAGALVENLVKNKRTYGSEV